jgi:hypothetical protein
MSEVGQLISMTNDERSVGHLTRIAPKPVVFTPLQGVSFLCSGPKCHKVDGYLPVLHYEVAEQPGPLYTELWCSRCGACYLVTWKDEGAPIRVERRGWRDVLPDGSWGDLHGKAGEE